MRASICGKTGEPYANVSQISGFPVKQIFELQQALWGCVLPISPGTGNLCTSTSKRRVLLTVFRLFPSLWPSMMSSSKRQRLEEERASLLRTVQCCRIVAGKSSDTDITAVDQFERRIKAKLDTIEVELENIESSSEDESSSEESPLQADGNDDAVAQVGEHGLQDSDDELLSEEESESDDSRDSSRRGNTEPRTESEDYAEEVFLPRSEGLLQGEHQQEAFSDEDVAFKLAASAEIAKVRQSKLSIVLQGLRSKTRLKEHQVETDHASRRDQDITGESFGDTCTMVFEEKSFQKGRCYQYHEALGASSIDVVVGVNRFLSTETAECVLVIPFEETFLGASDGEDDNHDPSFKPCSHVRVEGSVIVAPLRYLGDQRLERIPSMVYQPQTPGEWYQFAYYQDGDKNRCGRRQDDTRVLDLFSGCGGMSLGFELAGLSIARAVEIDAITAESFTVNKKAPVAVTGVNDFLSRCEKDGEYRKTIGRIDHIHASTPCQGFSGANINGGINDKLNNNLMLSPVRAIRVFQPITFSFENVLGLWKRAHIHYLKTFLREVMKLGYQVRCSCLKASDYGDPQKRPRIIVMGARSFTLLPSLPVKTHGPDSNQLPFVTARDALRGFEGTFEENETPLHSEDEARLEAYKPAPAVRGGRPPIHYSENRRISIEEACALQSFPVGFKLAGNKTEKRKQVGNAVPVELATAIARSIRASLLYRYTEEDT